MTASPGTLLINIFSMYHGTIATKSTTFKGAFIKFQTPSLKALHAHSLKMYSAVNTVVEIISMTSQVISPTKSKAELVSRMKLATATIIKIKIAKLMHVAIQ